MSEVKFKCDKHIHDRPDHKLEVTCSKIPVEVMKSILKAHGLDCSDEASLVIEYKGIFGYEVRTTYKVDKPKHEVLAAEQKEKFEAAKVDKEKADAELRRLEKEQLALEKKDAEDKAEAAAKEAEAKKVEAEKVAAGKKAAALKSAKKK
jgi:hypothetical protein